jgi:alpha-tubulin suppressor-like RCC1 family protein
VAARRQGPSPLAYVVVALAIGGTFWMSARQLTSRFVAASREAGLVASAEAPASAAGAKGANGATAAGSTVASASASNAQQRARTPGEAPKVVEVAVGGMSTCARTDPSAGGEVLCWGDNYFGQLGLGTSGRDRGTLRPIKIPGLRGVVQLAVRATHACARMLDGTVRCWGHDVDGEAGQGTPKHTVASPTEVPGVHDVVEIALGDAHVCARLASGSVLCWGDGGHGQLGDDTRSSRATPAPVKGIPDATKIAAGGATTCARRTYGKLWCWGTNGAGETGDGTLIERPAPRFPVTHIDEEIDDVAVGVGHACARTKHGGVWCWGWNRTEDLDPVNATMRHEGPVLFGDLAKVTQLAPSAGYGCFLLEDATLTCWGIAGQGRLGDGARESRFARKKVAGLDRVLQVATGEGHACAVRAPAAGAKDDAKGTAASVWCWGGNPNGELGDGTKVSRPSPVEVVW